MVFQAKVRGKSKKKNSNDMFNEKKIVKKNEIILLTLIILKYSLKNLIHPAKVQFNYTFHLISSFSNYLL